MAVKYEAVPHPLRVVRQQRGLSLQMLGDAVGMSASTLSDIETRRQVRVYVDQVVRLGRVLGVEDWRVLLAPENETGVAAAALSLPPMDRDPQ